MNKNKTIPADVYVAKVSQFTSGIQAIGTLLPNEEVQLISEASGKVIGIYFKEGTQVLQGQLLVKVDDADLQAQLKRAEYQLKLTEERLNRQKILLEKEAVSREEFDLVQTDYNILQADIDLLKVKIDKTEIRAPFSSIVGFRGVSVGSFLQPNTIITTLVDQNLLKIEFSIPEKYATLPLLEKKVVFTTELSEKEYEAIIYAVDSKVDQKTRTISLRAMYDNRQKTLAAGIFTRLKILTETSSDVILLPTQTIVPEMNGKKVWILENGKAISRSVTTGVRTENQIEIITGIAAGDSVLTTGLMQIKEGSTVRVVSIQ
jgi:membrane fusion protein (multidrug efflux system)